jgi:hypothetical protein
VCPGTRGLQGLHFYGGAHHLRQLDQWQLDMTSKMFVCVLHVCRRTGAIDVDEAMVLDMGQYEMPHASPADKKGQAAAGAPNLAGG